MKFHTLDEVLADFLVTENNPLVLKNKGVSPTFFTMLYSEYLKAVGEEPYDLTSLHGQYRRDDLNKRLDDYVEQCLSPIPELSLTREYAVYGKPLGSAEYVLIGEGATMDEATLNVDKKRYNAVAGFFMPCSGVVFCVFIMRGLYDVKAQLA